MAKNAIFNTVEEAIEDFREGRIVIVVDDEDRENEGDFIVAAEKITPEIVNFMAAPTAAACSAHRFRSRAARSWNLNDDGGDTTLRCWGLPFTVTVDLTGAGLHHRRLRSHDRAATIRALADPATPSVGSGASRAMSIRCVPARRGVLRRPGHTEAAVDLARHGRIARPAAL